MIKVLISDAYLVIKAFLNIFVVIVKGFYNRIVVINFLLYYNSTFLINVNVKSIVFAITR